MTTEEQRDAPRCVACAGTVLKRVGPLPLRTREGVFSDTVFKCRPCGTYHRAADFSTPRTRTHFDVSPYTNPQFEEEYRQARTTFFTYIIELAERHGGRPASECRVLDVGASFGHLIEKYTERGATCTAIEISERGRAALSKKNIPMVMSPEELPSDAAFDVICAIDSLYYFQDPGETLRRLRPHLAPEGVLIVRFANRTPLLNLLHALRLPINERVYGDAKTNFSFRGFKTLLEAEGFRIESVYLKEKGKRVWTRMRRLYAWSTLIASTLFRCKLTPGVILICKSSNS